MLIPLHAKYVNSAIKISLPLSLSFSQYVSVSVCVSHTHTHVFIVSIFSSLICLFSFIEVELTWSDDH